jgi:hypothetical protein
VTSGRRRPPCTALALPIALVGARLVTITSSPSTRLLSISHTPTRSAAHALDRDRRRRDHERLPALGASAAHAPSLPRGGLAEAGVDHDPAAAPGLITRRGGSRSRREVDPG